MWVVAPAISAPTSPLEIGSPEPDIPATNAAATISTPSTFPSALTYISARSSKKARKYDDPFDIKDPLGIKDPMDLDIPYETKGGIFGYWCSKLPNS